VRLSIYLVPLGLLPALAAQTNTSVTITNANVTYTQGALPATSTTAPASGDDLNAGGGDPLFQHWWFFRVTGDTRQFTFANDATATRTVSGSSVVTTWPNVDARGLFSATLTQTVISTGTMSGYLREDMAVTNSSAAPLTLSLVSYTDFDVGGTSNNVRGGLDSQVFQNTTPAMSAEFFAIGNTAAAVLAPATLLAGLTGTTVYDLPGWPGTFGPGNAAGAVQWSNIQLAPNQAVTMSDYLAIHSVRPQLVYYGTALAGSSGTPTIGISEFFVQDGLAPRTIDWTLTNGVPNFISALLVNLAQGNTTLAGLQVQVNLTGAAVVFATPNNQGQASVPLTVPPTPSFAGVTLYGQWFVADSSTPNGIASYSNGLQVVLGHW
jgi:hypothetical protein